MWRNPVTKSIPTQQFLCFCRTSSGCCSGERLSHIWTTASTMWSGGEGHVDGQAHEERPSELCLPKQLLVLQDPFAASVQEDTQTFSGVSWVPPA